jgi:membrane protein DedA with SNARE-associated domain
MPDEYQVEYVYTFSNDYQSGYNRNSIDSEGIMEFWLRYFEDSSWLISYSYGIVLLVLMFSFMEVVIPVIPGYTVLLAGSTVAAAAGVAPLWLIIGSSVGTWLASLLCYNLGDHLGESLLEKARFQRLLDQRTFAKIQNWFARYGYGVLLVSRLLPIARSGIVLTAGIVRYERRRTMAALTVSILVTATLYVTLGYWLGTRWRALLEMWRPGYNLVLILMAIGIGGIWGVRKWRRGRDGCVSEKEES